MASDVFTCLLEDIEPELVQAWPPVIRDTLNLLMEDEETLKRSLKYKELLKGESFRSGKIPRITNRGQLLRIHHGSRYRENGGA